MDKRFTHRKVDLKRNIIRLERSLISSILIGDRYTTTCIRDEIKYLKQLYYMIYLHNN
jgi:protein-arginine kinase activator protein McsA